MRNIVCLHRLCRATANLTKHADVCLLNGGSIRADLPAGNVTLDQITKSLPFGNSLVLVKVTGADVRDPRVGWGSGEGGGKWRWVDG
jgi:5'-nucleotidase/UDP-sugar diphosphatase